MSQECWPEEKEKLHSALAYVSESRNCAESSRRLRKTDTFLGVVGDEENYK